MIKCKCGIKLTGKYRYIKSCASCSKKNLPKNFFPLNKLKEQHEITRNEIQQMTVTDSSLDDGKWVFTHYESAGKYYVAVWRHIDTNNEKRITILKQTIQKSLELEPSNIF